MHVCRHLLVCRLEVKGVNLYTKKHLDTYVAMMGYNILYFGNGAKACFVVVFKFSRGPIFLQYYLNGDDVL
jgi:hypothetical protein